eukprot:6635921-Pyramimonas_sp.AAC.1
MHVLGDWGLGLSARRLGIYARACLLRAAALSEAVLFYDRKVQELNESEHVCILWSKYAPLRLIIIALINILACCALSDLN